MSLIVKHIRVIFVLITLLPLFTYAEDKAKAKIRYSNLFGQEFSFDRFFNANEISRCGPEHCIDYDNTAVCDDADFYCLNLDGIYISVPRDLDSYVNKALLPENSMATSWERHGVRHYLRVVREGYPKPRGQFSSHYGKLSVLGVEVPVYMIETTNLYMKYSDYKHIATVLYSRSYGILVIRIMSENYKGDNFIAVGRCGYLAANPGCTL